MNDKAAKPAARLAGVTSFGLDDNDYIAPPPREIRDMAKAGGELLGFQSDKPAQQEAPPAPKKRARQPSQYPDHYNLRLREGDRDRLDDYAYRHRMAKGEVFGLMLDLLEAEERRKAGEHE
jgi:hypothetical protein